MLIFGGFTFALLLIVAFLGWGRFVSKLILGRIAGDWPFQGAWGICALSLLGGILNVFGWVSISVNLGIVAIGALLLFAGFDRGEFFSKFALLRQLPIATRLALAAFALAACGTILASLFPMIWDTQDDSLAYAVFPVKMLQAGSLIEPFSHRRIIGYGAYPYLQSLVLTGLSHHELSLFDQGIATVLAAAAIAWYAKRRLAASWIIALSAGTVFMLLPPLRINLSPVSIFSLLSVTLIETVQLTFESGNLPLVRRALFPAIVSAAMVAMRANALAWAGSLLVFQMFFERRFSDGSLRVREKLTLLAMMGAIGIVFLLPWAVTLLRSSGTPFYPLIGGNYNRAIAMSSPLQLRTWLATLRESITYSGLQILLISTVLGVVVRALPRALTCYTAATLVTAFAMFAILNLWGVEVLDRYYSPFARVAQILILTAWCGYALKVRKELHDGMGTGASASGSGRLALAGMAVVAFTVLAGGVVAISFDWKRERDWNKMGIERSLEGRVAGSYKSTLPKAEAYRAALATIPKGARVLAQVDAPFLLDFREHEIFITDDLGVVSPLPGLPSSGEPEALVDYLSSLSIGYLMFVDPKQPGREGSALAYHLDWWTGTEAQNINNRLRAPYYLWFLNSVVELATRCEKLYESEEVVVLSLKLRQPVGR